MKIYSALIIDDEPDACVILQEMLNAFPQIKITGVFNHPEQGLQAALQSPPDVLFLDVEMPGMNGIGVIQKLKPWMGNTKVVFVTAFPEYGLQAAQNNAFGYLLKPVDEQDLEQLVEKVMDAGSRETSTAGTAKDKLLVWSTRGVEIVRFEAILYLEADKNYTEVVLVAGKSLLASRSLGKMENDLPEAVFVRISRKHIVNRNYLAAVDYKTKTCCLKKGNKEIKLNYTRKIYEML